ncbi:MAG: L-serine ammonia-lyase, iron-sulfur-dependent, subunit alpha [Dermatophilaceae bacterium]
MDMDLDMDIDATAPATHDDLEGVLLREIIPALGCTEPIAIALAAATAREALGASPERVEVRCSGNVIKNATSVVVPNSGGQVGIRIAAALAVIGGDSRAGLRCLAGISQEHRADARTLVDGAKVRVLLAQHADGLYVEATVTGGGHTATALLDGDHSRFSSVVRDGVPLPDADVAAGGTPFPSSLPVERVDVATLIQFAVQVDLPSRPALRDLLDRQIEANTAIANAGLDHVFGVAVGRHLLAAAPSADARTRARALTAAASDARMGGCSLPVMINAGSGNQGLTVSIPVIVAAEEMGCSRERLHRALIVSNLLAIYQKHFIGRLSAFCGVVTAAAASGAGIAFLEGWTTEQIGAVIETSVGTAGGIVCDGAKASCAAKVSLGVENAFTALDMVRCGGALPARQGLVGATVEETIRNVGRMARGMTNTDVEILRIVVERDPA